MIYPESLQNLINYYKKLPGIGEKSAERMALATLELPTKDIENFSEILIKSKEKLHNCKICGQLTEDEICYICSNEQRNHNLICVIEDYKSVFSFEKAGNYKGVYHVLNGLISPIEGINPEDLNITSLLDRINEDVKEIVIALNPSIEGEVTSMYIQKILEKKDVKVSRLSYGIPMGSDIEYLDPIMMSKALEDRKTIS